MPEEQAAGFALNGGDIVLILGVLFLLLNLGKPNLLVIPAMYSWRRWRLERDFSNLFGIDMYEGRVAGEVVRRRIEELTVELEHSNSPRNREVFIRTKVLAVRAGFLDV